MANPNHSGIIVCTQNAGIAGQADRIHDVISTVGDLLGQLLRVTRPKY
jgi:hypothetical protein